MKRLVSLFAAGSILCFMAAFSGVISLTSISWFAILSLFLGGLFCSAMMVIVKEKIGYH